MLNTRSFDEMLDAKSTPVQNRHLVHHASDDELRNHRNKNNPQRQQLLQDLVAAGAITAQEAQGDFSANELNQRMSQIEAELQKNYQTTLPQATRTS